MIELGLTRCVKCGELYWGDKKSLRCNNCSHQSPKICPKRARICTICGNTYIGYPSARYCTTCRIAIKNAPKEKSAVRKLGDTDHCVSCGKEYIVNSSSQKYCSDCQFRR